MSRNVLFFLILAASVVLAEAQAQTKAAPEATAAAQPKIEAAQGQKEAAQAKTEAPPERPVEPQAKTEETEGQTVKADVQPVEPEAKAEEAESQTEKAQTQTEDDGKLLSVTGGKALGMSILGNQEAPTSLVIVPWKTSELGGTLGISPMLDDSRKPVDKEVFMRALRYYDIRSERKP